MGRRSPEQYAASKARMAERNAAIIAAELERRGGHCIFDGCTLTKIDWHHRDPATKNSDIGSSLTDHSAERLGRELALCDPLCRKHHEIIDGRLARLIATRYTHVKVKARVDSKLSDVAVREIRRAYRSGVKMKDLATEHGVDPSLISRVVNGQKWAWVTE